MSGGTALDPAIAAAFPVIARASLRDTQLRKNVRHATEGIQAKRAQAVAELPDWEALREKGRALREHTMRHLDFYLEQFEANCTRAGGVVHWARDAEEARAIIVRLTLESAARGQPSPGVAGLPGRVCPGTPPRAGGGAPRLAISCCSHHLLRP